MRIAREKEREMGRERNARNCSGGYQLAVAKMVDDDPGFPPNVANPFAKPYLLSFMHFGRICFGRKNDVKLLSISCMRRRYERTFRRYERSNFFLVGYVEERLWWPIQSPNKGRKKKANS